MESEGRSVAEFRVARASRVLVLASRQNDLSLTFDWERARHLHSTVWKVREGGTPSPTLGTSVLPGSCRRALT